MSKIKKMLSRLSAEKEQSAGNVPVSAPSDMEPAQRPAEAARPIWENLITLNSDSEPSFNLLGPARDYLETDARKDFWNDLDYSEALQRDTAPLPDTDDREGYYGPDHFSYWASGLADARRLAEVANNYGTGLDRYLDLGCASGRVLRHVAFENPKSTVIGCDINRLHVEWCNAYLPENCMTFQNSSVPSLPIESNSLDMVSAFSVFTHIEALETAWLAEIRRVLKPGGLAWLTVHTEHTLSDMEEDWPLWNPTMSHPKARTNLDANRNFEGDRLVLRWEANRSYSSNVFYKSDYLTSRWGRILDLVKLSRRLPDFQDVMLMRKPI